MIVSKFWDIKKIEVNELAVISRGEVIDAVFKILDENDHFIIKGRNIFFIDTKDLETELNESLFVENVTVDKSYPNILRLIVKERQRSVVIASKDQLLTVDINGLVTGEAIDEVKDELRLRLNDKSFSDSAHPPLILCDLQELATSGYQVADQETVKRWLDTYKTLLSEGLEFRYIKIDDALSRTLRIRLENGIDLLVDILSPLDPQIETYDKYRQSKPKVNPKEYIDVRIPGKLYIK